MKKDRREIEELGRPCRIGSAGSATPLTQAHHHNHRNSQTTPSFCAYCREGFAAHGEARHGSLAATSLWGGPSASTIWVNMRFRIGRASGSWNCMPLACVARGLHALYISTHSGITNFSSNGNFSVVLASLQGNYSFSRFLTFTSLIQMDTSNTQAVSANLRLRYNYRPDSDLYIIYNVGTQFASIAPANPRQVRETRFAVKWTYSFHP